MLRAVSMLGCSEETAPEDLIINAAYRGIPFGAARWIIANRHMECCYSLVEVLTMLGLSGKPAAVQSFCNTTTRAAL